MAFSAHLVVQSSAFPGNGGGADRVGNARFQRSGAGVSSPKAYGEE